MTAGHTKDEFDPDVLFHRPDLYMLEFAGPNAVLVRMTEEAYQHSIFTDRQRIVAASQELLGVSTAGLLDLYESQNLPQPKLNFVFHVAHCGSTLLARALDHSSDLLVYREPAPLRQLAVEFASSTDNTPDNARWHNRLRLVSGLLGRRFEPTQAAVVKANVPVNFILPELMELNPNSCGILLYAPLRQYLLSVLKSPQHQRWVGFIVGELAAAIRNVDVLSELNPNALSTPQAAACIWLAQVLNFRKLAESTERVRTLNCETFFERPQATLEAAFDFFGVDVSVDEVRQLVAGDLFSHHAKAPGIEYDNNARKAELERLADSLAAEVDEGRKWVSQLMPEAEIPDQLPNALA